MREIKFRAWDKNKKEFWFNEDLDRLWFRNSSNEGKYITELFGITEITQYTGLKDKNGKEIYEGDILKINLSEQTTEEPAWGAGEVEYKTVVRFPKRTVYGEVRILIAGGTRVYVKSIDSKYLRIKSKYDEVIGNIYENPELLKRPDRKKARQNERFIKRKNSI